MAQARGLNGLTSGIDHKIVFTDINGVESFAVVESFNSKEEAAVIKTIGMDGTIRFRKLSQGWSGSVTLQRNSNFTDAYFAAQEVGYYLGQDQFPITITETITENDGTTSQYQYTNIVLVLDDAGMYSGTDIVRETFSFQGARKINLNQFPV